MSIQLSRFVAASAKPSARVTKCKNCFIPQAIAPGAARVVVSGGFGPSTRHLTLCPDCAEHEAKMLEALALDIRQALWEIRRHVC